MRISKVIKGVLKSFISSIMLILMSCEVGLGESVDVTAPVLEISSPADGSIIMNTFKMRGVGYDDTNIALIKVSVKSTSNGKEYASYYATADAFSKQWSVDINNKSKDANGNSKYEIPDGEYTVTVTAMDSAGRTTEKSRVYRIDNTPPVVVIKRPGAADSFGRTIKLTGDIADTNSLSSLYFTAFRKKEDGSLEKIRTIRQANISGVGLEYVIGKKYDNPANDNEIQLNNLYKELYGKEGYDGTSTLYCMVEVADCAREYEAPASEVRLPAGGEYTEAGFAPSGNLSRGFFVYNTIYSTIYSDKGYGLANSDLVSIYNGSYTGSKAGAVNEIKSYLEQNMMTTTGEPSAERMSMFTVNPNNFPYYEVSGYKYEADSSGVKKFSSLSNESKITVTVAPGRDQIDLDEKTVKLLLKKCNDNGEVIEGDDAETAVLVHSQTEIDAMTDDEEKAEAQKVRDAALSKDDTIKIVTGIGKRKTKCNYLVVVDGTDIDGNGIEASDGEKFGFFVVSVNKPPIISITEGPEDLSIAKDCNFTKFSGNVTMYADEVSLYCSITAKDEKGDAVYPVEPKEVKIPVDPKDFTWELELTDENVRNQFGVTGVPENSLCLYTISFRAVDNDENESGDTVRRVHVDTEAPKVEKINISPINTFNDRNCVNGKISISANVSENYELDRMHVYLKVGDNKCYDMSSSNLTLDFNYDTKLLKKNGTNEDYEGDLVVEVRAMDTAGNWSEVKTEKIYVNQESDKPVIRFSNTNEKINDASKIKQSSNEILNLFDKTGNNKIIANITDDDEVDQVVMRYKKLSDPDTDENWHVFVNESGLGTTSYPLSATLVVEPGKDEILEEGLYNIRYEITDKKTNGELPVQISNEFVIGIDAAAPTLIVTTASGAFIGEKSIFVVNGTLEEGSGEVELTRNGTKENIEITPKGDSNTSWKWKYNGKAGTEGDSYTFRAVDKFGKVTEQAFSYKVDNTNPLVELESSGETVYLGTNLSNLMAFKGTAEDPVYKASDGKVIKTEDYENLTEEQKAEYHTVDASGINHVEYTINGTDWVAASGTTKWSANIDFNDSVKEKNKEIYVRFRPVDNSGLTGEEKQTKLVLDSELPVITDLKIYNLNGTDETEIPAQAGSHYLKEYSSFVIKGKTTEKNFDKITCSAGGIVAVEEGADAGEYLFSYKKEKVASGTVSYTFTAVDLAKQSSSSKAVNVFIDGEAPNPEFSNITPVVKRNNRENVNGKITVTGTSSDNDKVVKTVLNCYVAGTEGAEGADYPVEPTKVVEAPLAGEADRFTFEINTAEFTDKRNLKLELVSTDRAGNVTAKDTKIKIVYIDQDTDKPVITLSNASTDVTEASGINLTTNLFEKTGKILGTITDDDAVGTVTAYYKKSGTSDEFAQFFTANPGTATYNLSAALSGISSLAEGEYEIKINVSDTKTDGSSSVNTEIGPFLIAVDDYAPAIAVTTPQNGWYSTNATVTGTASDASGIKSISSSKSAVSTSDAFANWQEDFTVGQKGETVTYTATDKYGRTGTAKFTYKVDILAPSVSVTTADVKAYLGTTFTTTKTFAGTATDPASVESITSDVSGVTRVEYIIKASGVSFADDDVWTSVSGTTKWNANIDFGTIAGDYDVYFRAVDNADNVTAVENYVKRSVTVDADVPAFSDMTVQYHNIDDGTWVDITEQDGTYYSKGNYTINGTITDSNLKSLTVTGVSGNLSVNSYGKFAQSFTTSGTKQFKALDKAEQSTIKNFNVYIDTQDPNVEISAVTPQVTANGKENNVNGIITVTGNASDNDKITSTILSINGNDVTDKNGDVLVAYNEKVTKVYYNESGMRYSYTIDTTKFSDKTNMTVGVKTFDRSGRVKSSTKELYIDQSTDIPVLSSSNFNLDATEAKENLFGMGMMTINVTAVDDDGVATFKYKIDDGEDVELVTGGNSTSYSKAITFERTLTKDHTITFTIEDINGNVYTNSTAVPFAIDNDVPSIGNLKIIRTKDTIIYEENAFIPVSYKLSGTASDASGIESIIIEGVNITGTDTWISDDITGTEGNNTVDVKATDIFGRTSYVTLKLIVDNTAPTWQKNNGTAQSPSLVNVDTKISGGTKNVLHANLNKDGKISWFNSENITLSGNAYDANGIAGYILTVNGNDSTANGTAAYSILAGYTQGLNTASLVVKDKAGNSATKNFTIYVDTVVPEINEYAVKINDDSDYKYINASANVIVSVGATDVTSGINKILIGTTPGFSASDAIATKDLSGVTATDNKKTCEIDISTVARAWSEGAHTIYIRAVDESGLDSSESSITGLIVDKTAPAFTYTSHASNSDVNKIITLSGSITEENSGDSAELWYRTSAVGETAAGAWSKSNATVNVCKTEKSWKIENFNTSTFTDNTKYDFQLRMTDAAGNKTAADGAFITLNINQNSDRPIIKLNFATDGTARLNSGKFAGTIADDDGDIKNLYFQVVTPKADGGYNAIVDDDAHWKELAVTSGAWEITDEQKLADGSYKIYFKVVDAKNEIFKTTGSDGLNVPYIQYSTNAKVYAPVEFSIDTEAPVISLVDVSLNAGSYLGSNIQNNKVMGGTLYKTAKFKVMAADAVSKGTDLTVQVKINTASETVYDAIYDPSDRNYYTDTRDLSGIASGIYQLTVTATDKSGMAATFTRIVIIDNTAPTTIKNVVPNSTTEVTGAFTMSGLVQDDENANSGIPVTGAMQYYIPQFTEKDTAGDALAALNWVTDTSEVVNKITQTSVSWSIEFSALAEYIGFNQSTGAISSDYSGYVITENTDLYNIPVWFKVVDNAGNVAYLKDNVLKFNPNADKPKVEITYPGEKEKESDGKIIMGGTARFQGTASDNEGIEGVYLQFDMDGDGTFENGEEIGGVATNENGKVYAGGDKNNIAVKIPVLSPDTYGFKAKGSLSWSSSIDLSGITSETVKVRTIAIDSDTIGGQLASAWSETITITVNNDIPQIEDLILTKYKDSSYAEIEKQITYEEDIFISGNNWRLEGVAKHKDGIASITVDTGNSVTAADDSGNKKFAIPVNKSSGSWSVTITATENGQTTHPKSMFCNLNIDNTPPKFADGNGAGTQLVLFKDNYGSVANKLSSTVNVQNSNGQYVTLSAKATEDGSGFARAVIYFLRDGTSEDRVYNVMESYGASRDANKTVLSSLTPTAESAMEDGKVYVNSDNLVVLYKTGVTRSTKSEISFAGLGTNKNIRAGGLILINGVYRRISAVNGDTVTLNEEVDTSKTTVQFVYGMVIDNSGESRRNDGSIKADDDDGMVETYIKSGNDYTWEAEIPSANIPDGPIQIHVVLFDKAGNMNHSSVTTRVSNNAPRITSVKLGTDLNGNGEIDSEEYEKFYAYANHDTSKGVEIWNLDTKDEMGTAKRWTAKNNLYVVPEFVGGTAPFSWAFTKSTSDQSLTEAKKLSEADIKGSGLTVASTDSVTKAVTTNAITITNSQMGMSEDNIDATYQFSFWDSTEETTPGENSSWTVLNAKVRQELSDNTAPTGYIKPFYWHAKDDNSLVYKYKNASNKDVNSEIAGHIELEGDINDGIKNLTVGSTKLGTDPKVSGKIVLRGKIYDDTRLGSFKVNFADFGEITISSFTNGAWTKYEPTEKIPYAKITNDTVISQDGHIASYVVVIDTARITGSAGIDKDCLIVVTDAAGKSYTAANTENQTANKATPVTYYATDSQFKSHKFYASAAASTSGSSATTIANPYISLDKIEETSEGSGIWKYIDHSRTGYYKMDVVPYVTEIWTGLSGYNPGNASLYSRASTGEYPVNVTETIKLYGWNLGDDTYKATVTVKNTSGSTTSISDLVPAAKGGTDVSDQNTKYGTKYISVPMAATYASGEINVSVNAVSCLNNKNKNNAVGSYDSNSVNPYEDEDYAYCYNRRPNGLNNNNLTDDISLEIWKFRDIVHPRDCDARNVVMHISPWLGDRINNSGRVGFSFSSGSIFWDMPGYLYDKENKRSAIRQDFALRIKRDCGSTHLHVWKNGGGDLTTTWPGNEISSYVSDENYYYVTFKNTNVTKIGVILSKSGDNRVVNDKYYEATSVDTQYWTYTSGNDFISGKFTLPAGMSINENGSSVSSNNTTYSFIRAGTNYDGFNRENPSGTFAFDAFGDSYGVALCADTDAIYGVTGNFQFFSRATGGNSTTGTTDLNYNYHNVKNARRIESSTYYLDYTKKTGDFLLSQTRVNGPSMATYVDGADTYVYLTYYDTPSARDMIKFRLGKVGSTANTISLGLVDLQGNTNGDAQKLNPNNSTILDSLHPDYSGSNYVTNLSDGDPASPSTATAVDLNGSVYVAWWTQSSLILKYTTLEELLKGRNGNPATVWNKTTISSKGGKHVSMKADADGNLHLAYMSNSGNDLIYQYIPVTTSGTSIANGTEYTVDAYDSVGAYCTIDVGRKTESEPWIPYITYRRDGETASEKIAYPAFAEDSTATTTLADGADSAGKFSNVWKIYTLPVNTNSKFEIISVGLTTELATGLIKNSVITEEASVNQGKGGGQASSDKSDSMRVSPNGTANPVVGYAGQNGYVIMGQKQ